MPTPWHAHGDSAASSVTCMTQTVRERSLLLKSNLILGRNGLYVEIYQGVEDSGQWFFSTCGSQPPFFLGGGALLNDPYTRAVYQAPCI